MDKIICQDELGIFLAMTSESPSNPIIGLVLPVVLLLLVIWSIRRSSKKKPVFHYCPICHENIRFSFGFQGGMKPHFRDAHPEYWRWLRKWVAINTAVALTGIVSIFPLLAYDVIPAHGPPNGLTPIGIAIWAIVTFSAMSLGIVRQTRGRRRFGDEWSQKHPLYQRSFGNLRGIEVEVKTVHGKIRIALGTAVEFLFNPIAPVVSHLAGTIIAWKYKTSRLDKYENGRLWFYSGANRLVTIDVKNVSPVIVDEQRIRVNLKRGQIELKTENSPDLNLILSVMNSSSVASVA